MDASGILSERSNNANVGDYVVKDGFDVAIALGNSFAHLPDFIGDQRDQRLAQPSVRQCVEVLIAIEIRGRNILMVLLFQNCLTQKISKN